MFVAAALLLVVGCSESEQSNAAPSPSSPDPGTSPVATAGDTLLKETFADDANGWGEFNAEQGRNYFEDGQYITDFGSAPFLHWLPEALATDWESGSVDLSNVVIETDVTITRGDGVAGVFCQELPDADAEYEWYEFVVRDGYAGIRRADMEGNLRVLAETRELALPVGEQFSLETACVEGDDGAAELGLAIDGSPALRAIDSDDPLEGGMVGIQIYPAPETTDSESPRVEWDSFIVSAAQR
jgi:hypothetical protein